MTPPSSAADLRLVPHYISQFCECGARLVLVDTGRPSDEIWFDEWRCLYHPGVYLDWPKEERS